LIKQPVIRGGKTRAQIAKAKAHAANRPAPLRSGTIETLIARVAAQDQRALRALYLRTAELLHGVLLRMLNHPSEAEDGLQEVFIRIWTRAPSFDPERGGGLTWLVAIARNYAIDQRRKQNAADHVTLEPTAPDPSDAEINNIADPGPNAEATHDARHTARRIIRCLSTLNPQHAEALRAAYLEGQSYRDLAHHHGVPLNTIRTWLRRSLTKLRDCMATEV
jgi:RNA polymerase sigma-70 factor, ECF subfamily